MKVLLVDDDEDLLDVTAYALRREGFQVSVAADGVGALRHWEQARPDVVVLDVALPRLGGFEVCRKIRERAQTPVILLTAFADEGHAVHGFRAGADDYVTKPFSPRLLAMRIRAVARRAARAAPAEDRGELRVGDLALDVEAHEARFGGRRARLTRIEFRLLHLLMLQAGRVVGGSRLVEHAWGYAEHDGPLLKTHVCHIRKKLGLPPAGPGSLGSVRGVGYRLAAGPGPD